MIRRWRSGFTLIELMVVIAIIAILAAILLPVFAQARERARAASCESNLKQFGIAFQAYEQDYNEKLPMFALPAVNGGFVSWDTEIASLVTDPAVYHCPSDPDGDYSVTDANGNTISERVRSYAVNIDLQDFTPLPGAGGNGLGNLMTPMGKNLSQIKAPSTTILMSERFLPGDGSPCNEAPAGGYDYCQGSWIGSDVFNPNYTPVFTGAYGQPHIHLGKDNYLFLDGHTNAMRVEQTAPDSAADVSTPLHFGLWDIRRN